MRLSKFLIRAMLAGLVLVVPIVSTRGATLGDIQIIAFQADTSDSFAFVALADLAAGDAFFFTDNSYTTASGPYLGTENNMTWTVPVGGVARGTVVVATDPGSGTAETVDVGTASGRHSGISNDGDQLFVFQGTSTAGTAIFAVNGANASPGWISTGTWDSNFSYLPGAFNSANGNRDLSDFSNSDNYQYTGTRTFATVTDARTALAMGLFYLRCHLMISPHC